jgi:hypothetical protein
MVVGREVSAKRGRGKAQKERSKKRFFERDGGTVGCTTATPSFVVLEEPSFFSPPLSSLWAFFRTLRHAVAI